MRTLNLTTKAALLIYKYKSKKYIFLLQNNFFCANYISTQRLTGKNAT